MQINQTTKRFLWGAGWFLSVVMATCVGFWFASYSFGTLLSTSALSRELVEAIQTQSTLELLDNGASEKARESMKLRMDTHIMALSAFSDSSASKKDRDTTNKFLRKVAEHRKNHKAQYPENIASGELQQAQAVIAEILKSKENGK